MSAQTVLVTGGAGFIGSHVVDQLAASGVPVVVVDDLSNSDGRWLSGHLANGAVTLHELDVLRTQELGALMVSEGVGRVIHLAASVDMRVGLEDNWIDVEQSILGTRSVLEAMRIAGVRPITFSSSSTVYGEPETRPTAEHHGPLLPISVYGAAKLAAEALLSSYTHLYDIEAVILRFGNVVGGRMNHGVIYDFLGKLRQNSTVLSVLGNGLQRKNYFLAEDCARGIIGLRAPQEGPAVLVANLGASDTVTVTRIAELVLAELGLAGTQLAFGTDVRGWPGDVPIVEFDLSRAHALGWAASGTSEDAVREAVRRMVKEGPDA